MTRSDLIARLAHRNRTLTAKDYDRIVSAILGAVSQHLAAGGKVELRGFGTFSTRERKSRTGRNPRTGEIVQIAQKRAVHFKPGKEIREMGKRVYASDPVV